MILRPVSPQSPCGPPTTNRPVGLMWYLISPWTNSAGNKGLTICSTTNSRISWFETSGLCCVETTTVSTRTGLSPWYSMVTWLLLSGAASRPPS